MGLSNLNHDERLTGRDAIGWFRAGAVALSLAIVCNVLVPALPIFAAAPASAESLFQDGVMKETTERDPEGAIALYKEAADRAGLDHRLASKARLRMGSCLERLGKTKDAEQVYLQIVSDSAVALGEIAQEAQAGLERLQAQDKKNQDDTSRRTAPVEKPEIVEEFSESRASLGLGGLLLAAGGTSYPKADAFLRYRVSGNTNPSPLFLELGGVIPTGNSNFGSETKVVDANTTDSGSSIFKYQVRFTLVKDLPHGHERWLVPEFGGGLAVTTSRIDVTTVYQGPSSLPGHISFVNTQTKSLLSPYFSAGLHFWPDNQISMLLTGSYTGSPLSRSIDIASHSYGTVGGTTYASPTHTSSFDFPTDMWSIGILFQIKLGSHGVRLRYASRPSNQADSVPASNTTGGVR